jgi:hypothetical protein
VAKLNSAILSNVGAPTPTHDAAAGRLSDAWNPVPQGAIWPPVEAPVRPTPGGEPADALRQAIVALGWSGTRTSSPPLDSSAPTLRLLPRAAARTRHGRAGLTGYMENQRPDGSRWREENCAQPVPL